MSTAHVEPEALTSRIQQPDTRTTALVDASRTAIACISIGLGLCGIVAPRQVARLMGDDPTLARPLALRDAAIGMVMLGFRGPAPLLARTAADVSDAIRLRHRSPLMAVGALGFGLWSAGTAIAARISRRR